MSERAVDDSLEAVDKPSGGGSKEDWYATGFGLALLLLAIGGFFSPSWVIW